MSRLLVTSLCCALPDEGAPAEIVFLPAGNHKLTPKSHPKGIAVNLPDAKGEAVASAFNADLAKRGNVGGWCDFEHSRKQPVSCYPTGFRYEAGVGVVAAVDWSASGRAAVEGRDVRFFSPEFYVDSKGFPTGLPDRGPIGGLVTEPAFRDIPAIAAADADDAHFNSDEPAMKDLVSCGLLSETEAARENAEDLAKQRITAMRADATELADLKTKLAAAEKERDELKTKVTAAEEDAKKAAEKRAGDLVTAAIDDGRIAKGDTAKADKFRERISAGDEFAEEVLATLPKIATGIDRTVIQAGADKPPADKPEKPPLERLACAIADPA